MSLLSQKNLVRSSASECNAVKNIVLHFKNKLSCSLQVLYVVVGVGYQAILPPAEITLEEVGAKEKTSAKPLSTQPLTVNISSREQTSGTTSPSIMTRPPSYKSDGVVDGVSGSSLASMHPSGLAMFVVAPAGVSVAAHALGQIGSTE